ncbi:MAG: hypothetical protein ACI4D6_07700 [Chordicoccus sp.]
MKYPYMTFNDETEVTHSDLQKDGTVLVYIETPTDMGFKNLTCVLPDYTYKNNGYSKEELDFWKNYIQNNAHIILELAHSGGFDHASAV